MFKIILYINIFVILMISHSCQKKVNVEIAVVKEWINREIKFDDGYIFTRLGKDSIFNSISASEYKILVYTDSIGCVGCNLKLPQWMEWMKQMDSISDNKVSFLFFIHPKDMTDLLLLLQRQKFNVPICIDKNNSLNKLNHFPSNVMLQTFLLDEHNKVLAIGNPMHNPKIKELYINIISGKTVLPSADKQPLTVVSLSQDKADLGDFSWHEEREAEFIISNAGKVPLVINDVITSCGCTTVDYSKKPVLPGENTTLKISYKAEQPGYFSKTITVYCNAENSPFKLRISGNAE